MLKPKEKTISDEYFDFKLWCIGHPSRQESFARYVARRLKKNGAKKVLEIGSGRTCRLSRILEENGFEMTCIDTKIDIMEVREKGTNIILQKEKFDLNYDLKNFDFIVGQEPCDATEHIVRACVNQDKPFIISLCGVPHTLISGENFESVYDWYDYLINISSYSNIRLRYVALDELLKTPILLKD